MSICLKSGTAGWNCATKGKIRLGSFCFLVRGCFLFSYLTSAWTFATKFFGYPLDQAFFKIVFSPSNKALEELVLGSLSASPLTKPPFVAVG